MKQSGPNGENMTEWTEQKQGGPNKIEVDRMDPTGPKWME